MDFALSGCIFSLSYCLVSFGFYIYSHFCDVSTYLSNFLRCTCFSWLFFFNVLAMYLLIFPEFPGCAFSSISVQIHTGADPPFFVRNRQISVLACPLVLSIYYKFPRLTANPLLYIFTCPFFTISENPLCNFEKLFRNNLDFFVYLLQNMNVLFICEVGHAPLFVQSAQILNQNMPIRCAIFTKIRLSVFQ